MQLALQRMNRHYLGGNKERVFSVEGTETGETQHQKKELLRESQMLTVVGA